MEWNGGDDDDDADDDDDEDDTSGGTQRSAAFKRKRGEMLCTVLLVGRWWLRLGCRFFCKK
jgi:hypothetical protein